MIARPKDENGRIKLTWAQLAWGISSLVILVGAWYDLRTQVKLVVVAVEEQHKRILSLENRNRNVGFTQQDAEELRQELLDAMNKRKGGR